MGYPFGLLTLRPFHAALEPQHFFRVWHVLAQPGACGAHLVQWHGSDAEGEDMHAATFTIELDSVVVGLAHRVSTWGTHPTESVLHRLHCHSPSRTCCQRHWENQHSHLITRPLSTPRGRPARWRPPRGPTGCPSAPDSAPRLRRRWAGAAARGRCGFPAPPVCGLRVGGRPCWFHPCRY